MDYSKLSNEDLLALKAGDYSKVSNEGLLALKGQSAPAKPVEQPSAMQQVVSKGQELFDKHTVTGQAFRAQEIMDEGMLKVAGSKFGQQHPNIAAAATGAVGVAQELAGMASAPKAAQQLAAGVKGAWRPIRNFFSRKSPQSLKAGLAADLKQLGTPATDAVKAEARKVLPPLQEKVRAAKEARELAGQNYRNLEGRAMEKLKTAKGNLDVVEHNQDLQIPASTPKFQKIIKSPGAMARYTSEASKLAKKGAIDLAKEMKPKRLQFLRKVLQEGRRTMSGKARGELEDARETMSRALEYADDYFKAARVGFHKAKNLVDRLPQAKTRMTEKARQLVGEAGRDLQAMEQKFRALTQEAQTADKARRAVIESERLRVIQKAQEYEDKVQRAYKIGWAAMGIAGTSSLGYAFRKEIFQ